MSLAAIVIQRSADFVPCAECLRQKTKTLLFLAKRNSAEESKQEPGRPRKQCSPLYRENRLQLLSPQSC